jgi:hypothetical protein
LDRPGTQTATGEQIRNTENRSTLVPLRRQHARASRVDTPQPGRPESNSNRSKLNSTDCAGTFLPSFHAASVHSFFGFEGEGLQAALGDGARQQASNSAQPQRFK